MTKGLPYLYDLSPFSKNFSYQKELFLKNYLNPNLHCKVLDL